MDALNVDQARLLTYVRVTPGIAASKLGRMLRLTPRVIRTQLDELESLGLLERHNHPEHPDANELHVTKAGVAALEAAT